MNYPLNTLSNINDRGLHISNLLREATIAFREESRIERNYGDFRDPMTKNSFGNASDKPSLRQQLKGLISLHRKELKNIYGNCTNNFSISYIKYNEVELSNGDIELFLKTDNPDYWWVTNNKII